MTPEDLRKEARAAELLANMVSYGRDKARLQAKAEELRMQADALEQRPPEPRSFAPDRRARTAAALLTLARRRGRSGDTH